ncbi:hypothetical protein K461DRAFT_282347 [Myriangium duriaei CBS 260.36]|uniref:Uncharacterized protein n=1 Tax=Myriangium duriaei CBS 260.36 TaxID=1168546 RepID=A0A9P4IW24_9PEZI|nr:hypothetical protein K461DRAFT_282347 [Myriangium duriaei CBS 260.36]
MSTATASRHLYHLVESCMQDVASETRESAGKLYKGAWLVIDDKVERRLCNSNVTIRGPATFIGPPPTPAKVKQPCDTHIKDCEWWHPNDHRINVAAGTTIRRDSEPGEQAIARVRVSVVVYSECIEYRSRLIAFEPPPRLLAFGFSTESSHI